MKGDGIYGLSYTKNYVTKEDEHFLKAFLNFSPWFALIAWMVFTVGVSMLLTAARRGDSAAEEEADDFFDGVGDVSEDVWDDGEDEQSLPADERGEQS